MTERGNPPAASPATAIEVLAALQRDVTGRIRVGADLAVTGVGPEAEPILASYFAPGPQPRYDTPHARAEAEAEPEASL
jgi:hypothetical protein